MNPFEAAPEFVGEDNRQHRPHNPVSRQQMHHKHKALLPSSLVRGKTVLDLGCALGATGHWCLSNGATKYRGVEGQEAYATKARTLLEKYHPGKAEIKQESIESYLAHTEDTFDIVSILGVLYVFTDYYSILKKIATIASETIAIESVYPFGRNFNPRFVGVEFKEEQHINLADDRASLAGRGTRISPKGFEFIMGDFGFTTKGQIYPEKITESLDMYNNMDLMIPRFLMVFTRTGQPRVNLSQDLLHGQSGQKFKWMNSGI